MTLPAPNSGAQLDQMAPRLAVASSPTTASGMFGTMAATRSPRPTPRRRRPSAAAATDDRSSSHEIARTGRALRGGQQRRPVRRGAREDRLRVVERRALEPSGARHRCVGEEPGRHVADRQVDRPRPPRARRRRARRRTSATRPRSRRTAARWRPRRGPGTPSSPRRGAAPRTAATGRRPRRWSCAPSSPHPADVVHRSEGGRAHGVPRGRDEATGGAPVRGGRRRA